MSLAYEPSSIESPTAVDESQVATLLSLSAFATFHVQGYLAHKKQQLPLGPP